MGGLPLGASANPCTAPQEWSRSSRAPAPACRAPAPGSAEAWQHTWRSILSANRRGSGPLALREPEPEPEPEQEPEPESEPEPEPEPPELELEPPRVTEMEPEPDPEPEPEPGAELEPAADPETSAEAARVDERADEPAPEAAPGAPAEAAEAAAYEAVAVDPAIHAAAVAALDVDWVDEGIAPFRGGALTEADVVSLAARDDVIFLVLLDRRAVRVDAVEVAPAAAPVGFAWADVQPDGRDILLDTRAEKRMGDLHFIYVHPDHRGGAGRVLYSAIERACIERSCTHLELIADSVAAEQLLRFYGAHCGMSYMFTRLRKELKDAVRIEDNSFTYPRIMLFQSNFDRKPALSQPKIVIFEPTTPATPSPTTVLQLE